MDRKAGVAGVVCGRRAKWLVLVAWLVLMMVTGPLGGKLTGVQKNDLGQWLPGKAESTQVVDLQKRFQTVDTAAAVVVYERPAGITPADQAKAAADARALAGAEGVAGTITGPVTSQDGRALLVTVPIRMGSDGFTKVVKRVDAVRKVATTGAGGLSVHVAGPAGFDHDSASAFAGIDGTLLGATVLVVIVILLLAYRSPVLWLLPVMCAGIALTTSQAFIYLLAKNAGLTVNGQSAGILTVLVFGAATDYALLLIARYREELRVRADRHMAMAVALRRAAPAIIASAGTVVAALLCLMAAEMNNTRGLGPVLAIGIAVGLLTMLTLMPALLVIFGRWIFWPAKPKPGTVGETGSRRWLGLGDRISVRPRIVWVGTALVLGALALGLTQLNASGLSVKDSFIGKPDSVVGQTVLSRHFPAGQDGQPVVVIGKAEAAGPLKQAIAGTSGIVTVSPPVQRDGLVSFEATLRAQPDSQAARATVDRVRTAAHAVTGADAKVGGQTALTMDMNAANTHDNKLIIPIVLIAVLLILGLLLRAVVAPLLLMATVVLSYAAALGTSALLFKALGFKGVDTSFALFVFVFLVALGVDYNIFLMTRVREEAQRHGTRRGVVIALSATGGVITSAGLVLAATFAVFASMPLVFFAELGIAVSLGILLDTFIVRSVVVTALALDLGGRIWAPGKLARTEDVPVQSPGGDRDPVRSF